MFAAVFYICIVLVQYMVRTYLKAQHLLFKVDIYILKELLRLSSDFYG
jgi:hypothetical protein